MQTVSSPAIRLVSIERISGVSQFLFLAVITKRSESATFGDFLPVTSGFDSCLYGTDFRRFAVCMHLQTLPDLFALNLLTFRLTQFVKS